MAVRPDGTIVLGPLGSVTVAAATVSEAEERVRRHLGMDGVRLRVAQFNSKRYYVIFDGASGEQVIPLPADGNESVMDVLNSSGVVPRLSAKPANVWVARRTPDQGDQILPVDYRGLTQSGLTRTNYQLQPGDRVYVKTVN